MSSAGGKGGKGGAAGGVTTLLNILVAAGKASPTPPVGPALGQRGVKTMDFCKQFNDVTKHLSPGIPIPTKITIRPDKTFSFVTTAPPTAWLLKSAAGLEKGSARPGIDEAATLSLKHIFEIAQIKKSDPAFAHLPLEKVASRIVGSCRSIGIRVVA